MNLTLGKTLLGLLWAGALVAGLYGLSQRALTGHEQANYGSYVPWGLWVAQYLYFAGLSAGAFLLATLGYVFEVKPLQPVGRLALLTSMVTLLCGLFIIWIDLGQPLRFWMLYWNAQPTSMLAWMVWLYTAFFLLLVAQLWLALRADLVLWGRKAGLAGALARVLSMPSHDLSSAALRRDQRALRALGILGIPLAIGFSGGVGALFGVIGARPYWNSSLYPILFLASAVTSGSALLTFLVAYFWPERRSAQYRDLVTLLGRITLGVLLVDLLLELSELGINLWAGNPAHADAYRLVLFGPFWWVFWIGHLALGVLLPLLLLVAWPRAPKAVGAAGGVMAALFITVRINIVIPGLVIPEMQGLELAFADQRLTFSYFPSPMEFLVSVFAAALGVALFFLGYRLLPIAPAAEGTDVAVTSPILPLAKGAGVGVAS